MTRLLLLALCLACAAPAVAQVQIDAGPAAVNAALTYVRGAASLQSADAFVASGGHTSSTSGVTYVYVQQQVGGIDVDNAVVSVALDRQNRVVYAAGSVVADGEPASASPSVSAAAAASIAAQRYGLSASPSLRSAAATADRAAVLDPVAQGEPTTARLVYTTPTGFPDGGALRLAWAVVVDVSSTDMWRVLVDAATGAVIHAANLVVSCSFGEAPAEHAAHLEAGVPFAPDAPLERDPLAALSSLVGSYRVYPAPVETPNHTSPLPPADARTAVANPADAMASPSGWHSDGTTSYTITRGNNAWANIDRDGTNGPDPTGAPDGGATLTFAPALDLSQAPTVGTNGLAAVVNLFYWVNLFHDVLWQYGFNEPAGNFQTNNFGRGGTDGDAVLAEAQDSGGTNNANFNSGTGRMQMFLWTFTTPGRDGDFSGDIIAHEYGHGVSTRLVGGPTVSCLGNAEQMGEGWSDFYGLMLTMRATDTRTQRRGIGTYVLGEPITGTGIRGTVGGQPAALAAPYSTDFAINTLTYGSTVTAGQSGGLTVPHGVGFAWMTILWDVTWDMIDAHGFSADIYNANGTAGNQIMMNLVTEGFKLTPCNPGFVQGRDAILAADALLYPDAANPGRGIHYATLWGGFARRGLGFSASQGVSSSNADNVQAFDVPLAAAQVSVASAPISRLAAPGGTASATVAVGNAGPTGNVVYSSSLQSITYVPGARPAAAPAVRPVAGTLLVRSAGKGDAPVGATVTAAGEPAAAAFGAGGPDAAGYAWDDSNQPGGPVYNFQSIVSTGTAITACTDDSNSPAITLPFSFPFYGTSYPSLFIGSNGILSFSAGTAAFENVVIPTAAAPNTFIAPFWDDLDPSVGGSVRYQTVGGTFVVQFTNVPRFGGTTGSVSFQVILTPTGEIRVQYQAVPTTNTSATIGIENQTGSVGLQVASDAAYAAPNLAVRFRRGRQWVTASNSSGQVVPNATAQISLAFDATGLTEGTYTADLVVQTNAISGGTTTIPVALTVGGQGVVSGGPGWRLLAAPATGVTVANLAAMNLVQGVPGYYPGVGTNLLAGYTGSGYTPLAGGSTILQPGSGFFWYFYNQNITPGGASNSTVLPTTLATTNPAVTADVPVTVHASGNRYNMLGNPFGTSMRIDNVASWPGAANLGSVVAQVWDASTSSYDLSTLLPTVAPWQGFWVQGATAGSLTIPATARTTGGVLQRDAPAPLVGFTLAQAEGPLQDRAAVLTFPEGATDGADVFDADKLAPVAGAYVVAALGDASALQAVASWPAPTTAAVSVPLHVASVGAGERLVLSWPHLDALSETWAVTLTDTQTNTTVDLRTATEYAFTVAAAPAGDALAMPETVALTSSAFGSTQARFIVTVGPRGATAGEGGAAGVFALSAPAPNPARGRTTLAYSLAAPGAVRLTIVDLLGREISVVADGDQAVGRHVETLDTGALAPGVYVVRLASGVQQATQRLVVMR